MNDIRNHEQNATKKESSKNYRIFINKQRNALDVKSCLRNMVSDKMQGNEKNERNKAKEIIKFLSSFDIDNDISEKFVTTSSVLDASQTT